MTCGLVGAGRVGSAFAFWLQRAGFDLAVYDIRPSAVRRLEMILGQKVAAGLPDLLRRADVIFVATPDRATPSVCRQIARRARAGSSIFHFSGALPARLSPRRRVAQGVMHPLASFPDLTSRWKIRFAPFSLSGDERALRRAKRILKCLGARYFVLGSKNRIAYHLASVFVSNFSIALLAAAQRLAARAGIRRGDFMARFGPMLAGVLADIEQKGLADALSGPVARGDASTIRRHRRALRRIGPEYVRLYDLLSKELVKLSGRRELLGIFR